MIESLHQSPVRFTTSVTLAEIANAHARKGGEQTSSVVSKLFDSTKVHVSAIFSPFCKDGRIESMDIHEWNALRDTLAQRIIDVVNILHQFLDLHSNEWKNAPAIWEMLSFSTDVLRSPVTPLPDAIRIAKEQLEKNWQSDIDLDELLDHIDEVIHQTHGRRLTMERVMQSVMDTDVAETTLLDTHGIPANVITQVKRQVQTELETAHTILTGASTEIPCEPEQDRMFHLAASDVTRVSAEEPLQSRMGDVYLVRSKNVEELGDHYIVIIGGLVQKAHGLRPADMTFAIHPHEQTPLHAYRKDEALVLLKLNDTACDRFYAAYNVPEQFRHAS